MEGGGGGWGGKRDKNEVSRSWSFVSVRPMDFYDRVGNKRLESKGRGSEKDFEKKAKKRERKIKLVSGNLVLVRRLI